MALLTRKEFAALCHTNAQVINTNVSRGNLVVEFKKINTENAQNKAFFDRYQKKFDDKNRSINDVYTEVVDVVKKKQSKNKTENKSKETARVKGSKKQIEKTNPKTKITMLPVPLI